MGAAPTEIAGEGVPDVRLTGPRVLVEQRLRLHHHAARAITALRRLLGDERCLERIGSRRCAESFDGRDAPARDAGRRDHAGADRVVVEEDGARAALPEPAADLRAGQPEIVAQDEEQRLGWIPDVNGASPPVYGEAIGQSLIPNR